MARILKVDRWNPDAEIMLEAGSILRNGGLVAFPTETVYGLGADGLNPEAVRKIFLAKGRPADNPLILHLADAKNAEDLAEVDARASEVMAAFWPGPLTLVLRARPGVPAEVTAGLPTVALRVPDHPVALALIGAAGRPVAAPSANRSGRPSPTDAEAVAADLGNKSDLLLDAGPVDIGLESTVIDLTGRKALLLRPGGTDIEKLETFLGKPLELPDDDSKKRSPGTRYKHYSPAVPVRVWTAGETLHDSVNPAKSGFMGISPPPAKFARVILFESEESYARGVFAGFRQLEAKGLSIVAEWPEPRGIGLALRDRIRRAAACTTP
ncbi:MAG: L-threonylcarbamoyladenylate synthase [Synergistaceae bacterium]|nr:L-threonylcarbamoyladenylate synthase [Synergistaceae bacterium]